MNNFKSMVKTGKDFAVILYNQVNEDIENTIIEIWLDKMKMRTILCEGVKHLLLYNYCHVVIINILLPRFKMNRYTNPGANSSSTQSQIVMQTF